MRNTQKWREEAQLGQLWSGWAREYSTAPTKWKRIDEAISRQQFAQGDGRPLLAVACKVVEPSRLMSAEYPEAAEHLHAELDTVLSTEGYELTDDGRARKLARKATFEEARNKALSLREHLQKRGSHEEVLKHCRENFYKTNRTTTSPSSKRPKVWRIESACCLPAQ